MFHFDMQYKLEKWSLFTREKVKEQLTQEQTNLVGCVAIDLEWSLSQTFMPWQSLLNDFPE